MEKIIEQGAIYICELNGIDSEQTGERPCLIVQLNALNNTSPNTIIVPITSKCKKALPTHYILNKDKYDYLLYKTNTVLCESIRTISKNRLNKYIGKIDEEDLTQILTSISNCFREVDKYE